MPVLLLGKQWNGQAGTATARKLRCQTGSKELELPPIMGAVSGGVINKCGISSPIGLNSKYAIATRIKISLPKRNQRKQWTLEFLLKSISQRDFFFFFFCLLTNLLPKNVSIHRKQLAEKKKLYYLISQQFIEEETR